MVHVCACPSMDHLLTGWDNMSLTPVRFRVCVYDKIKLITCHVRGAYTL